MRKTNAINKADSPTHIAEQFKLMKAQRETLPCHEALLKGVVLLNKQQHCLHNRYSGSSWFMALVQQYSWTFYQTNSLRQNIGSTPVPQKQKTELQVTIGVYVITTHQKIFRHSATWNTSETEIQLIEMGQDNFLPPFYSDLRHILESEVSRFCEHCNNCWRS